MSEVDLKFYTELLHKLRLRGLLTPETPILVTCAGACDAAAMRQAGLSRVTISNLDVRMRGDEYAPYAWSFQDVEKLDYPDNTFDFVVVHQGLHHCYSPHRGLLEMYRVARRGILVVEPRDAWLVRLCIRWNLGQEYEVAAVADNDLRFGGARNTALPNFVYRWTEDEVAKTLRSFVPWGRPQIEYFYSLRLNTERYEKLSNPLFRIAARIGLPVLKLITTVFPKQGNRFAFLVLKPAPPADLQPWIKWNAGQPTLDTDWVRARYHCPEPRQQEVPP